MSEHFDMSLLDGADIGPVYEYDRTPFIRLFSIWYSDLMVIPVLLLIFIIVFWVVPERLVVDMVFTPDTYAALYGLEDGLIGLVADPFQMGSWEHWSQHSSLLRTYGARAILSL